MNNNNSVMWKGLYAPLKAPSASLGKDRGKGQMERARKLKLLTTTGSSNPGNFCREGKQKARGWL